MDRSAESEFLIDEEGNLFGLINIVDAMVVLLVLAVVVAGGAVVLGGQPEKQAEPLRHGTISYTVPLGSDAAALEAGDTLSPVRGGDTFTVTNVTRGFSRNGHAHVTARVAYRGVATVGGGRVYGGQSVRLASGSYLFTADLLALDQRRDALQTGSTSVVVAVNGTVAESLSPGQTARIAGQTVGTVERVQQSAGSDATGERTVALTLTTWRRNGVPRFGGHGVRVGTSITVVTDRSVVDGRIVRVGTTEST